MSPPTITEPEERLELLLGIDSINQPPHQPEPILGGLITPLAVDTEITVFDLEGGNYEQDGDPGTELLSRLADVAVSHELIGTDAYTKEHDPVTYEVHVESRVALEDYRKITPPEDMDRLMEYARSMDGKKIIRINATAAGGGVAIMLAPLMHLYKLLGIDAHWYALKPDEPEKRFFDVTKQKFHNVLQGVANPETRLNDEDRDIYSRVIAENARVLEEPLSTADVIVIDDWQPAGLIPHIKGGKITEGGQTAYREGLNPNAKIIFRDHIHTEGEQMVTPGTPQFDTWQYIWKDNQVCRADAFVTHPVDEFVPPNVPDKTVVYMPATADLLDDLNRDLTEQERRNGIRFINEQLAINGNQRPLDPNRPYIVLIARFDPSKGMPQGMESYVKAREKMMARGIEEKDMPQLVILGNGSVDDPDGVPELEKIMRIRSEYGELREDIKVARVPHNDIAINALLKGAKLALQPSIKEGFESRVSDAIFQGVPVIGSNRGGIPLQIIEGRSGHVIDPYDTDSWAQLISELMTDTERYEALKKDTEELSKTNNYRFTTIPNALRWLALSTSLLQEPHFLGNRRWVDEMIN